MSDAVDELDADDVDVELTPGATLIVTGILLVAASIAMIWLTVLASLLLALVDPALSFGGALSLFLESVERIVRAVA